jgi:uncharacterized SAM-binding protein YcdF (DUF218 family)
MLKNENIICISSIDWDFIWQANQEIMSSLAKNGNRVLFIENTGLRALNFADLPRINKRIVNWFKSIKGFRKEADNLYIYSPIILPFPYSRLTRWINKCLMLSSLRRWIKIMGFFDPIIWTFLPTPLCLDILNSIPHKASIYYNIDNLPETSAAARKIIKPEREVVKKSDVVFAMSCDMFNYFLRFNKNTIRMPAGVHIKRFLDIDNSTKPQELINIDTKIVGYIGGIRKSIDIELIAFLADKFSDFTFVFVGPIQINISRLRCYKNIMFTGQKEHRELPYYLKYFDTCIIPYMKDAYADSISPAKLNEYLIMGKPVISTNLKEIANFNKNNNILYIANNYDDFARLISESIRQDSEELRKRRIEVARNNDWDKKIEQMSEVIEFTMRRKEDNISRHWSERLIELYKDIRRKSIRFAFILSLIWIILFYTPALWFLSKPLKVSQIPQKSDAIVVFAGGVGESGQARQGYEERVVYAVELYKQGLADNLIFSSGYMYVFKEPLLMKALAISLGVPENAVILEDKARNTYENVDFVARILGKKGWDKILLVSSPYHMRRASLVFNKVAKNIRVDYTPIPKSIFYSHEDRNSYGRKNWKRINLEQIKGIVHEYLGILYYWWRGYI